MKDDLGSVLAFLASSAIGCLREPAIYGPLRMLEAMERIIAYARDKDLIDTPGLLDLADRIEENKLLCMTDEAAFASFVEEVGLELVDYL